MPYNSCVLLGYPLHSVKAYELCNENIYFIQKIRHPFSLVCEAILLMATKTALDGDIHIYIFLNTRIKTTNRLNKIRHLVELLFQNQNSILPPNQAYFLYIFSSNHNSMEIWFLQSWKIRNSGLAL